MLQTKIESLLFITHKPMTINGLVNFFKKQNEGNSAEEIETALRELQGKYNIEYSGINIIEAGDGFQMVTSPSESKIVQNYIKEDVVGELTPASLEALTVIAYKGPISKVELEHIRGVNCSLILRNLLIRGLIDAKEDKVKMQAYYQITTEFLKYLGLNSVQELPDYEKLHSVGTVEEFLEKRK